MIAYIGKVFDGVSVRELTDWRGNKLGTVRLKSSWKVNSHIGDRMYQAYAVVDGIRYTGRTFGEGMSIVLRKCAKQYA
jgi:hypothetical protein